MKCEDAIPRKPHNKKSHIKVSKAKAQAFLQYNSESEDSSDTFEQILQDIGDKLL